MNDANLILKELLAGQVLIMRHLAGDDADDELNEHLDRIEKIEEAYRLLDDRLHRRVVLTKDGKWAHR